MYDISVCMPYFERLDALKKTMITLREYNQKQVEISIVDDGSTREPVPRDIAKDNIVVSWLPEKTDWRNPCVPLNLAVKQSSAPLILLQSPETYHAGTIAYDMQDSIKHYKDIVLACVRTEGLGFGGLKWYMHPVFRPKKWWFCQLMSRKLWEEVGGMDESYRCGHGWDDNYLERALSRAGGNWIWRTDCEAVHICTPKKLPKKRNKRLFQAASDK